MWSSPPVQADYLHLSDQDNLACAPSELDSASNPFRRWNLSSVSELTMKVTPFIVRPVNPSSNHSRRSGCPGSRESAFFGVQRKVVRKIEPFREGRGRSGFLPHALSSQAKPRPCHPIWRTPFANSNKVTRPITCIMLSVSSWSPAAAQCRVASSLGEKVPLRNPSAISHPSTRTAGFSPAHALLNNTFKCMRAKESGNHFGGRLRRAG